MGPRSRKVKPKYRKPHLTGETLSASAMPGRTCLACGFLAFACCLLQLLVFNSVYSVSSLTLGVCSKYLGFSKTPRALGSDTPMAWIIEPEGGSIFWILPGLWARNDLMIPRVRQRAKQIKPLQTLHICLYIYIFTRVWLCVLLIFYCCILSAFLGRYVYVCRYVYIYIYIYINIYVRMVPPPRTYLFHLMSARSAAMTKNIEKTMFCKAGSKKHWKKQRFCKAGNKKHRKTLIKTRKT